MKKMVSLIVVFGIIFVSCTTMPKSVEIEPFEEVVTVSDITADVLFVKVNSWMVDSFKNADSVIQFSDKEAGIVKGKYITPNVQDGMWLYDIESTITVEVREGRYRISMDNPIVYYKGTTYAPTAGNRQIYPLTDNLAEKLKVEWANLAKSLNGSLSTPSSDW